MTKLNEAEALAGPEGAIDYSESLSVKPRKCTIYKKIYAGGTVEWSTSKMSGGTGIEVLRIDGAEDLCGDSGKGCYLYTCQQVLLN